MVLADSIAPYSTTTPDKAIGFWSQFYNISAEQVTEVIRCESQFNPTTQSFAYKDGVRENSWGLVQINLDANPQVTKEEATNPDWALPWMLQAWKAGHQNRWTCYTMHYGHLEPLPFEGLE